LSGRLGSCSGGRGRVPRAGKYGRKYRWLWVGWRAVRWLGGVVVPLPVVGRGRAEVDRQGNTRISLVIYLGRAAVRWRWGWVYLWAYLVRARGRGRVDGWVVGGGRWVCWLGFLVGGGWFWWCGLWFLFCGWVLWLDRVGVTVVLCFDNCNDWGAWGCGWWVGWVGVSWGGVWVVVGW